MKRLMILAAVFIAATAFTLIEGEKYNTKTGKVTFFSTTPVEDIKATTNQANVIFDKEDGVLAFRVPVNSFEFEKALMQKHFNGPDYMDSKQYPSAQFKGTISNYDKAKLSKPGKHTVSVSGTMTMHGKSKQITEDGTIEFKDGKYILHSVFKLNRKDYGVEVPKQVSSKIAEQLEITVDATLSKYQR